jgi:hypothetical protein
MYFLNKLLSLYSIMVMPEAHLHVMKCHGPANHFSRQQCAMLCLQAAGEHEQLLLSSKSYPIWIWKRCVLQSLHMRSWITTSPTWRHSRMLSVASLATGHLDSCCIFRSLRGSHTVCAIRDWDWRLNANAAQSGPTRSRSGVTVPGGAIYEQPERI